MSAMNSSRKRDRSESGANADALFWKQNADSLIKNISKKVEETERDEQFRTWFEAATETSKSRVEHLKATNAFVKLCVGGSDFVVPAPVLLQDPDSIFHHMLSQHFELTTNEEGSILIDRDPDSFRHVLNYLRGYKRVVVPDDEQALVRADIEYYHLPGMWAATGMEPPNYSRRLLPGPGINADGTRLRVAYSVAHIGDHMLLAGRHQITFEVVSGEYLGIGLCSELCVATDQEFHKTPNCCVYYMTGVFYSNFGAARKEEGLEKFVTGDVISVILDMDERIIEYQVRGYTAKIVSCATASRLRFAVVGKLSSGARIVPNSRSLQRPLNLSTAGVVAAGQAPTANPPA
jgi:hypothetical protein